MCFLLIYYNACIIIGMQLIPQALMQNSSQLLQLLDMLYIHSPVLFNNAGLLALYTRMRAEDANRRNAFAIRRYMTILARAPASNL